MLAKLTAFNNRLIPGRSLDEQMDNAFILAQQLGFDALVYDYSPVPIDLNGTLITPRCCNCATRRPTGTPYGAAKGFTRSTRCNTWH